MYENIVLLNTPAAVSTCITRTDQKPGTQYVIYKCRGYHIIIMTHQNPPNAFIYFNQDDHNFIDDYIFLIMHMIIVKRSLG